MIEMTISGSSSTSTTTSSSTSSMPNSIGYTFNSGNRTFGLASGINVDSIVSQLMQAASVPLVQMEQQRQLLEWKQDDYRSMNSLLLDLQTSTFNMSLQSTYLTKDATTTDSSIVTATANNNSANTTYNLNVTQLATAATNKSTNFINTSSTTAFDPSASIQSMVDGGAFLNAPTITQTATTSTDDKISVSTGQTTVQLEHGNINTSSVPTSITVNPTDTSQQAQTYTVYLKGQTDPGGNSVELDPTTGTLTFSSTAQPVNAGSFTMDYTHNTVNFTITTPDSSGTMQNHDFSIDTTSSLNDIIDKINQSDAGVTCFYDNSSGTPTFSISRNQTGDLNTNTSSYGGAEMAFSAGGDFLTTALQLNSANEVPPNNASLTLNGVQMSKTNNNFSLNGVNFNLLKTGSATISISNDIDAADKAITDWVNKYNDTISQINAKLAEKTYPDYQPLTNQQQTQMSSTQVDLWTAKAKSGMLSNDQILPQGLNQMRIDIYSTVDSVSNSNYSQLSQIGITTSSNYQDNGKLVIDDSKLRQALATDPNSVMQLFTNQSSTYSSQGIMQRLNTTLTNTINNVTQEAGNDSSLSNQYYLGQEISDYDTRISDFQSHLDDVQNQYYNEFSAMESMINQANQQSSIITSSFSGK